MVESKLKAMRRLRLFIELTDGRLDERCARCLERKNSASLVTPDVLVYEFWLVANKTVCGIRLKLISTHHRLLSTLPKYIIKIVRSRPFNIDSIMF